MWCDIRFLMHMTSFVQIQTIAIVSHGIHNYGTLYQYQYSSYISPFHGIRVQVPCLKKNRIIKSMQKLMNPFLFATRRIQSVRFRDVSVDFVWNYIVFGFWGCLVLRRETRINISTKYLNHGLWARDHPLVLIPTNLSSSEFLGNHPTQICFACDRRYI